jgi:similar to spore coat protein
VTDARLSNQGASIGMNTDSDMDIENFAGMDALVDPSVALDLLLTAKNGVRNCAYALSEIATPDVRQTVHGLLEEAIAFHGQVSQLMISKGWLHAYNVTEQFPLDMISADMTVKVAGLNLYPDMPSPSATRLEAQ